MRRMIWKSGGVVAVTLLTGCMHLAPRYERPAAPVPGEWPATGAPVSAEAQPLPWRRLVQDARATQLVERALASNRDLRAATLSVTRSQALLKASTANRYPTVAAGITGQRAPNLMGQQTTTFNAGLAMTAWEIDLFGRLSSLDDAARADVLGNESARRATELSLITQVLSTYLTLIANEEQLQLADRTLVTRNETLRLTQVKVKAGASSELEMRGIETLTAQTRATRAQAARQRDQSRNALALLLGEPVPASLLPAPNEPLSLMDANWLTDVPVSASSQLLLARPDVVQAEQRLVAANANIGAARAALFPHLTLTSSVGSVSDELSGLFKSGTLAWSIASQLAATIFDGGRNRANLEATRLTRDIAIAQYEKSIQTAFQEVADGLVGATTLRDQTAAQRDQLVAERDRARLVQLRRTNGAASDLEWLDAQRSLFLAEQTSIQARLQELQNRLQLYKALGGEYLVPQVAP